MYPMQAMLRACCVIDNFLKTPRSAIFYFKNICEGALKKVENKNG